MNYIKTKRNLHIKKYIYEVFLLIIGCFIMASGTSFFLLPNQLSSGGFAGLSTIAYYLLNIPLGTTMFALNIPLFILGYIRIGKKFLIKTLLGTTILAIFIDILDKLPPLTQDRLLGCIYGGIAMGIGTAIVLKSNSSTGGTDLLSYIIRSYKKNYRTSSLIVGVDTLIIALNVIFFKNIEIGLYSAIAIYLMGKIIDIVFEGTYFTKLILIVSEQNEEIAKEIEEKIQRGATGLYGKGMYTNKEKLVLMCAASRRDVARIKIIARKLDSSSFIIITNSREVVGLGFKKS